MTPRTIPWEHPRNLVPGPPASRPGHRVCVAGRRVRQEAAAVVSFVKIESLLQAGTGLMAGYPSPGLSLWGAGGPGTTVMATPSSGREPRCREGGWAGGRLLRH